MSRRILSLVALCLAPVCAQAETFGVYLDQPLPGVGFAVGDETMRLFLESRGLSPAYAPPTQAYVAVTGPELAFEAQNLAGELRRAGLNVAVDFGDRKLGDQIKAASKHGIPYLIVLGQNELESGVFSVRELGSGAEEQVERSLLPYYIKNK